MAKKLRSKTYSKTYSETELHDRNIRQLAFDYALQLVLKNSHGNVTQDVDTAIKLARSISGYIEGFE